MGHFIISVLRRRNLVRQLQEMSYLDQLTRFGNRHAMDERIADIRPGESIGAVYCDVTGLKQVNDTEGHKAGDRLILRACDCLREVFGDQSLFRIGGDEFLVLCARMGEKELAERVESLKGFCGSIPSSWQWASVGLRTEPGRWMSFYLYRKAGCTRIKAFITGRCE